MALGRKSWLFAGSEREADRAALMYTRIQIAKLNDVDPQAWLADVLAKIADTAQIRLAGLLPSNWRPRTLEAESRICLHDRRHRPVLHDEGELLLEPPPALERIFDCVDALLKDDLLRGMIELLMGQPAPMRQRPMAASAVNPAVPRRRKPRKLRYTFPWSTLRA